MPSDNQGREKDQCLIKIVDFGAFLDGSDKQSVADALLESFKTTGFVYLINHGLSQEKINRMFDLVRQSNNIVLGPDSADALRPKSKRFFALPHAQKMMAPHPPSGTHHRGTHRLNEVIIITRQ